MDIAIYLVEIVVLSITIVALMARLSRQRLIAPLKWFLVSLGLLAVVVYWVGRFSMAIEWRLLGATISIFAWETLACVAMLAGSVAIWISCRRGSNWFGKCPAWRYGLGMVLLMSLAIFTGLWIDRVATDMSSEIRNSELGNVPALLPSPLDDKDNAAPLYEQFVRAGKLHGVDDDLPDLAANGLNDPALAEAIGARRELLTLARKATDLPGYYAVREVYKADKMMLPDLNQQRWMANELSFTARWEAHTGDMDNAIKDINRVYTVATHSRNNPAIVGNMVSQGIYRIADQNVIYLLPLLRDREQLASIQLPEAHFQEDQIRAFKIEKVVVILNGLNAMNPYPRPVASYFGYNTWRRVATNNTLALLNRANQIAADVIKHQAGEPWPDYGSLERDLSRSDNRVASVLAPYVNPAARLRQETEASRRAVIVALGQTRYRLDHGSYNDDPSKLVPAYFPAMPIDPFDGKPMRMKLQTDGSLLIYSVGQDQMDDGGDINFHQNSHKRPIDVGFELAKPLTGVTHQAED